MIYDYNGGLPMKLISFLIFQRSHPNLSQTINDWVVYERVG